MRGNNSLMDINNISVIMLSSMKKIATDDFKHLIFFSNIACCHILYEMGIVSTLLQQIYFYNKENSGECS